MVGEGGVGAVRDLLRIRDVRLLLLGQAVSQAGDWLYDVALLVYVLDATGSAAWVAAAGMVRLLPWILFAPLGGLVADRVDRRRVLVACDLVQLAGMLGLMVVAAANGSPALAIGVAGLAATAGVAASPSLQAALPLLVEERRLASVNALMTAIGSLSMVVGPAIAALLLVLGSPAAAFGLNAITFAFSAACALLVRTPLGPSAHEPGDRSAEQRQASAIGRAIADLGAGVRVLASSPAAAAYVLIGSAVMFAYGAQVVLWAVLADTRLETGGDGLTLLYVAYGIGGVAATIPASRAASDRSGGAILVTGTVIGGIAIASLAAAALLAPVLALVAVQGVVVTIVDVLVITLLQRTLGPAVLGRAVGAMDSLTSIAMVGGSVMAPALVTTLGLEAAFLASGMALVVAGGAALVPILAQGRRGRDAAASLAGRVQALAELSLFAGAPRFALEAMAAGSREIAVEDGAQVIREGDEPDALYVLLAGSAVVTARATGAEWLNVMGPGDFFGEIGLVKHITRTATVTATQPCRLMRIEGETFLSLVGAGVAQRGVLGRSVGLRLARSRDRAGASPDAASPG
jgi:MFS family permease